MEVLYERCAGPYLGLVGAAAVAGAAVTGRRLRRFDVGARLGQQHAPIAHTPRPLPLLP
jgi:hypothetical protein